MIYDKANEVIEELFECILNRYQIGCYLIFNCVNLLHYACHNTNLKRDRLSVDSPDWVKTKNAVMITIMITISINNDNNFFQNAATVALSHK